MSRNERVLKLVSQWVKEVSPEVALNRLITKQLVKVATADKICSLRYTSVPRDKLANKLLKEMAKDGFVLADKAS